MIENKILVIFGIPSYYDFLIQREQLAEPRHIQNDTLDQCL